MLQNLPPLSLLVGFLTGLLVNIVVNELSHTRRLFPAEVLTLRDQRGWFRFSGLAVLGKMGEFSRQYLPRTWIVLVVYTLGGGAFLSREGGGGWESLLAWLSLAYFGVVVVLDIEYKLILFPLVGAGIVLGGLVGVIRHGLWSTVLGGIAGFAIMYALFLLGVLFLRFMARRRGVPADEVALGFGDVNLAGVIGLYLGWPGVLAGLYLAIMIGGVISLALIVFKLLRRAYSPFLAIPYGPCLLAATAWFLYFRPLWFN